MSQYKFRVPLETVIIHRNGKRVTPQIGKPFAFSEPELRHFAEVNPDCVRTLTETEAMAYAPKAADNVKTAGADEEAAKAAAEKAAAEKAAADAEAEKAAAEKAKAKGQKQLPAPEDEI